MKIGGSKLPDIKAKLKPFQIPDGLIVIVDTREQDPLFLGPRQPKGLTVVRDTLHNGDYSIKGFENKFMIERKGISDLIPYLTRDHKKTKEKLNRCKDYLFKAMVIEATEHEVLSPVMYGQSTPEQIRQGLVAIEMRYDLHIYYNKSRESIERWVLDRMIKFYTVVRETK